MLSTSEIIQNYLKVKNINQSTFALLLKVTPQYISNIFNNKKFPSKKFIKDSIKVLNISEKDILLINKYEMYRRFNIVQADIEDIEIVGKYTNLGYISEISDKKISLYNFEDISKDIKAIAINTNLLNTDFKKGDIVFLEFLKEDKIYLDRIVLLDIDGFIDFAKLQILDNKLLVRYINKENSDKILNLSKKINILAIVVGKYTNLKEV